MTSHVPHPNGTGSADRLMRAGLAEFNAVGVNAASIHTICERAEVSIGSAYHHFGSKQGLADALLTGGLDDHLRQLAVRLEQPLDLPGLLRAVIESLVEWINAHSEWARFIYLTADSSGADSRVGVNDRYRELLGQHIEEFMSQGALRPVPPECLASLTVGPVHDYTRKYLSGMVSAPPAAHVAVFVDSACRALCANF